MKRYISADKHLPGYYSIPMGQYLEWMFWDQHGGADLTNKFGIKYPEDAEKSVLTYSEPDTQIKFLVSRGFDTASKINELIQAWRAGVDVVPIIEEGFHGTTADLKRLVADKRESNYQEHKNDILQKYEQYWDESQSAYVLDTPDSKQIVNDLVDDLEQFKRFRFGSNKPAYSKKYITPGKYYKVYVHWD